VSETCVCVCVCVCVFVCVCVSWRIGGGRYTQFLELNEIYNLLQVILSKLV